MGFRTIRILLQAAGIAFIVLALVVAGAALNTPAEIADPSKTDLVMPLSIDPQSDSQQEPKKLTARDFKYVAGKKLRYSLKDSVPVAKPKPKPQPIVSKPTARFNAKLVGTLIDSEAQQSRAWLLIDDKQTILVRVGESLTTYPGNPKIISIDNDTVTIDVQNNSMVLKINSKSL